MNSVVIPVRNEAENVPELRRRLFAAGGLAAVVLLFVLVGLRGQHHYDEFGYLYAATHYPIRAVVGGQFEPSNLTDFFNGKIGHVIVLKGLVGVLGHGLGAIHAIQWVYTLLVVLTAVLLGLFLGVVWRDTKHAVLVGAVMLLTPVTVYLGPKLLSEVPSGLAAVSSLVLLAAGLRAGRRSLCVLGLLGSGLCLAAAWLCRGTSVLMVAGGWLALWAVRPKGVHRLQMVGAAAAISAVAGAALFIADAMYGLKVFGGIHTLDAVLRHHMSAHRIARCVLLAFGPALLVATLALASRRRDRLAFYVVWLASVTVPQLIGLRYPEGRYLIGSVPGLAGLTVLGGEALWQRLGSPRRLWIRLAAAAIVVGGLAASNAAIQPKMTSEIDDGAYAQAMTRIAREYPEHPILVSWTWSDYHFLRLAYPRAPVYVVNSLTFFGPSSRAKDVPTWNEAQARWYGERYLGDLNALQRAGQPPWIFIDRRSKTWDTHRFSWVWENPELRLTKVFEADAGRRVYDVYEVTRREAAGRGRRGTEPQ